MSRTLMERLEEIASKHPARMANDPLYRLTYLQFQASAQRMKDEKTPSHYDRDGYCDNPARGF